MSAAIFYGFSFLERDDGNIDNTTVPKVDTPISSAGFADRSEKLVERIANVTHSPIYSLADIANLNSPLERSTALHNVLSEANKDQVLELLEQSKQLDSPARVQTQAVILQKLVRVNPSNALTQVAKFNQLGSSDMWSALFSEWAQFDLNEAISYASTLDNTERQAALKGILQERIDLADQQCREIARQLGNEQYAINMITSEKLSKSIAEPEEIWKEVVEEAQGDPTQIELLTQIAQLWVEKHGLEALDYIFASLDNKRTRSHISIAVFRELAHTNPSGALEHTMYMETLDRVGYWDSVLIVVEEWAKFDPHSALDAIRSISQKGLQRPMFVSLVETWATHNPHSILEELDTLPNEVVELATKTAMSALASNSPLDAAERVPTVDDESLREDIARSVIDHWIARDMDGALDWVLKDPDLEFQRTRLLGYLLLTLVEHDPERAMHVALAHPIVENELGPEYWVIARLTRTDADKAIEFLPEVRDGITKTEAYRSLGFELARQGMTDKALQLLKQVPQYPKETYLGRILSAWMHFDPTDLFESLAQMPSEEVASLAAYYLLLNDPWGKHLNSEQRETVRTNLTEEDAKRLKQLSLKTVETQRSWR